MFLLKTVNLRAGLFKTTQFGVMIFPLLITASDPLLFQFAGVYIEMFIKDYVRVVRWPQ